MKHVLAASALLLAFAPTSRADVLDSTEILRVRFTIDNNWTGAPPDVLRLNFGIVQVLSSFTTRSAALYDGANLLGTDSKSSFGNYTGTLSLNPSNGFVEAGSLWTFKSPAVVDFTTILDGSIDGRIDFTIATGEIDIPLSQVNLSMINGTSASGGNLTNPAPTVVSVEIIGDIGTNYCSALPNSSGLVAELSASGSNSVANQMLTLTATGCPANVSGIFFLGTTQTLVPFGDGFRCISLPIDRIPPFAFADPTGVASRTLDFTAPYAATIQPGVSVNFQYWYRDAAAMMSGFNLTDAIEIPFLP